MSEWPQDRAPVRRLRPDAGPAALTRPVPPAPSAACVRRTASSRWRASGVAARLSASRACLQARRAGPSDGGARAEGPRGRAPTASTRRATRGGVGLAGRGGCPPTRPSAESSRSRQGRPARPARRSSAASASVRCAASAVEADGRDRLAPSPCAQAALAWAASAHGPPRSRASWTRRRHGTVAWASRRVSQQARRARAMRSSRRAKEQTELEPVERRSRPARRARSAERHPAGLDPPRQAMRASLQPAGLQDLLAFDAGSDGLAEPRRHLGGRRRDRCPPGAQASRQAGERPRPASASTVGEGLVRRRSLLRLLGLETGAVGGLLGGTGGIRHEVVGGGNRPRQRRRVVARFSARRPPPEHTTGSSSRSRSARSAGDVPGPGSAGPPRWRRRRRRVSSAARRVASARSAARSRWRSRAPSRSRLWRDTASGEGSPSLEQGGELRPPADRGGRPGAHSRPASLSHRPRRGRPAARHRRAGRRRPGGRRAGAPGQGGASCAARAEARRASSARGGRRDPCRRRAKTRPRSSRPVRIKPSMRVRAASVGWRALMGAGGSASPMRVPEGPSRSLGEAPSASAWIRGRSRASLSKRAMPRVALQDLLPRAPAGSCPRARRRGRGPPRPAPDAARSAPRPPPRPPATRPSPRRSIHASPTSTRLASASARPATASIAADQRADPLEPGRGGLGRGRCGSRSARISVQPLAGGFYLGVQVAPVAAAQFALLGSPCGPRPSGRAPGRSSGSGRCAA